MATIMNIQNDNCLRVVLADGVIDIPKGAKVIINGNGKTFVDGIPLEEYAKNRKNE